MLYTIKGINTEGFARYIQFSWRTGDPIIQGRMGYNAWNVVLFKTEEEANNFLSKFEEANHNNKYDIKWSVSPFKGKYEWIVPGYTLYVDNKEINYAKTFALMPRENPTKYGMAYSKYALELPW